MKVSELMEKLRGLDPDVEIVMPYTDRLSEDTEAIDGIDVMYTRRDTHGNIHEMTWGMGAAETASMVGKEFRGKDVWNVGYYILY